MANTTKCYDKQLPCSLVLAWEQAIHFWQAKRAIRKRANELCVSYQVLLAKLARRLFGFTLTALESLNCLLVYLLVGCSSQGKQNWWINETFFYVVSDLSLVSYSPLWKYYGWVPFANPFSDSDNPDCLRFRASRTKNLIHTIAGCYTDLHNFVFSFLCSSVFSWSNGKNGTSLRSNGSNWDSSTWCFLEFEPQQS